MERDWVVWVGCVGLFFAGAVWAAIPIPTNFFVVANIHDLFEMVAAVATAGALYLAATSINAWRLQVSAQMDHDHAKRALLGLFKYRDELKAARSPMMLAYEMAPDDGSPEPFIPGPKGQLRGYQRRLSRVADARVALYEVLSECEVIWGDEIKNKLFEIYRLENELTEYVRLSFLANGGIDNGGDGEVYREILKQKRKVLNGYGDEFDSDLKSIVDSMDSYLRAKLIQ